MQTTLEKLAARLTGIREHRHLLLLLDYDGTLVEIAPRPELARPTPALLQTLSRLTRRRDTRVAVVTGRSLEDIQGLLPVDGLDFLASHGGEGFIQGRPWSLPGAARPRGEVEELKEEVRRRLAELPDWWWEEKPLGLAVHYRHASPEVAARIKARLKSWLAELSRAGRFRSLPGKKVVEILPAPVNKGAGIRAMRLSPGFSGLFPVYIGDDATDASAFEMLQEQGLTIKVGSTEGGSAAGFSLARPGKVRRFLALLAA
jgi:trehalose-phosphatase